MRLELKNPSDAFVNKVLPTTTFSNRKRLYLIDTGANESYAYMFFTKPFPRDAYITEATLSLYGGETLAGVNTLTVQGIQDRWDRDDLKWNNKPSLWATPVASQGRTAPGANTQWSIDVADIIQQQADGRKQYGFRLSLAGAARSWFHSSRSVSKYRPVLEIKWVERPEAPEELSPADGNAVSLDKPTLRFDFTTNDVDSELTSLYVEIYDGAALEWSSGEVFSDVPQLDLSTTSYPGIALAATRSWRVQVRDDAGALSDWSELATFTRIAKSTLTIDNPSAASPFVTEMTPPIIWTFSGTQKHYQVFLSTPEEPEKVLWTSGKKSGAANSVTIPRKDEDGKRLLKKISDGYRVKVRAWDGNSREKTPGDPRYVDAVRDFTVQYSAAVAPVTSLVAVNDTPWPWNKITWSRAVAADQYEIFRNGELIDKVDAADVLVSGSDYEYLDKTAAGRKVSEYTVVAVVNGVGSSPNPTASATAQAASRWLIHRDSDRAFIMLNPRVAKTSSEVASLQYPGNNRPAVLITQTVRGFEGSASGIIVDDVVPGITAEDMKADFDWMRENSGEEMTLFNINETLTVLAYNMVPEPMVLEGKVAYAVSFDFAIVEQE